MAKYYAESHEWIELDGTTAKLGISQYAADSLGDITYVEIPASGKAVSAGDVLCTVESVKAVSDVVSPVTGEVEEVNETLADEPQRMNQAPYDSWFVKVKDITDRTELMDAETYEAYLKTC